MLKFTKLFEPIKIGSLELRSRVVMPPMCTRLSNLDGSVSERLVNYYAERAKGGAGLIIVEPAIVDSQLGHGLLNCLNVDRDRFIPGLGEIARAVHEYGASIALQTAHFGRQVWKTDRLEGRQPVSASDMHFRAFHPPSDVYARALTVEEVEGLIERFAEAAKRTQLAGFDAVEFHGTNGYLIAQFFSPYTNKRTDRYGGDIDGRARFGVEIVKRAREKIGSDFPIIFRISGDEFIEGGLKLEEAKVIASKLEKVGVDIIDVNAGLAETYHWVIPPMAAPRGCHVPLAEGIKKAVKVPVIVSGRINDPLLAEKILQAGKADLIGMGRPLIADPELPRKAVEGRLDEIRICPACNECVKRTRLDFPLVCTWNPAVGKEKYFKISPALKAKRVLVVGGGAAGMTAAYVSALRSHQVTMYERNGKLGGQLLLASVPPHKEEFENARKCLIRQLEKLEVDVELSKEVTPEIVEKIKPDVVILATGASPLIPKISGIDGKNVVTAWDVLSGNVSIGENVIVLGGGLVGCETAAFIAEQGGKVTVVEMLADVAVDMEPFGRVMLLEMLAKIGVDILVNSKVEEITDAGAVVIDNKKQKKTLGASTIVLALGAVSNKSLYRNLRGKVSELYMIGDCVKPRKCLEAVHEGWRVALEI